MNKAKALFAAGVIVVVAAASGALWYLNENGRIGNEPTTTAETTVADIGANAQSDNTTTAVTTTDKNELTTEAGKDEINSFLSVFSKVYFAEQTGSFNAKNCSGYDLLLFAYLHIKNTDKTAVINEERDDAVRYYSGVSIEKVNRVLDEYFGLVVDAQSVYTENDYEFFMYENGYFYTPSADGLAYKNYCVSDSVAYSGDSIVVQFTVYSGEEKYATGEARIKTGENGMKLDLYKIYLP